jgi:large subunit ribosomal protein L17
MRHYVRGRKLGRTYSHRKALMNNLVKSLIVHKQIKTTDQKAKEAVKLFERLITFAKRNDVAARREAYKYLQDRDLVKILFDDIAPEFSSRNGGYTRIDKVGVRRGDAALISQIQILGFEKFVKEETESNVEKIAEPISEEQPAKEEKTEIKSES